MAELPEEGPSTVEAAEHLLAGGRYGSQAFTIHEVHHPFRPDQIAPLLNDVHIAAEHHPVFLAEVLGLAGGGHNTLIGIHNAHIARGGDHACELIGALLIRFNCDQAR
jgi:hypothetical protein